MNIQYLKLILISVVMIILSCEKKEKSFEAKDYDYSIFSGKTISSIQYCYSCGPSGDFLIFKFTDSLELKVYAYKYPMRIY